MWCLLRTSIQTAKKTRTIVTQSSKITEKALRQEFSNRPILRSCNNFVMVDGCETPYGDGSKVKTYYYHILGGTHIHNLSLKSIYITNINKLFWCTQDTKVLAHRISNCPHFHHILVTWFRHVPTPGISPLRLEM